MNFIYFFIENWIFKEKISVVKCLYLICFQQSYPELLSSFLIFFSPVTFGLIFQTFSPIQIQLSFHFSKVVYFFNIPFSIFYSVDANNGDSHIRASGSNPGLLLVPWLTKLSSLSVSAPSSIKKKAAGASYRGWYEGQMYSWEWDAFWYTGSIPYVQDAITFPSEEISDLDKGNSYILFSLFLFTPSIYSLLLGFIEIGLLFRTLLKYAIWITVPKHSIIFFLSSLFFGGGWE